VLLLMLCYLSNPEGIGLCLRVELLMRKKE